ncbi:MAG: ECF transporter S component [Candidatus Bathyarchaeia archaeon]
MLNKPTTSPKPPRTIAFKIAAAATFAALVAVATLTFVIPIPATSGYFNLGDTIIYIAALLFGPFVGLIAGAGASIADILVAPQFALGTFTIKAIEGFLVGYLTKQFNKKIKSLTVSATLAILIAGFEMVTGYFLYEIFVLGYPTALAFAEVPFNVIQMLVGLIIAIPVMHAVLKVFPQLKSYL